jgi:putative molybdopterin biosynthesis protein
VAAAIAQGRADWGMAIESVARASRLRFVPYQEERYDFAVPKTRMALPAVQEFIALLSRSATRKHLSKMGFNTEL